MNFVCKNCGTKILINQEESTKGRTECLRCKTVYDWERGEMPNSIHYKIRGKQQ